MMNRVPDPRRGRRRGPWLVGVAALALLAVGCGRESSPTRPPVETVVVEGRVGAVPTDHDLQLEFYRFDVRGASYMTGVDAAGSYRAELPVGDYRAILRGAIEGRIFVARAGGATTVAAEAETLRLRPGDPPWRRDFGLGALRLVVEGLEEFEGWKGSVDLHRVRADTAEIWNRGSESADVNGGVLDLHTTPFLPGAWQLKLRFRRDGSSGGYTETYWCASQGPASTPDRLRIGPDSLTTHRPTLPRPVVLTGRITGAWQEMGGQPPPLTAMGTDGLYAGVLNAVQPDGSFQILLPRARPVRISVGVGAGCWIGGDDEPSATVFDPEPGDVIGGITGVVGGLLVRPMWTVPFQPFEQYVVELYGTQGSQPVRSEGNGGGRWMRIVDLRPGEYRARIVSDSRYCLWRSQWFDRAESAATAGIIVIPADGGFTTIDPVLERGGGISGSVQMDGAAFRTVFITKADAPIVVSFVEVSEQDPTFDFPGLEDGHYRLGLYIGFNWLWRGAPAPPGTHWYPGVTDWESAGDLEIIDAGVISDLRLAPAPTAR